MRARNFRVESVCRVLTEHGVQVAPRTYRSWKSSMPSARTVSDAHLTDALRATVGTPEGMYGRRKMTAYLRRLGLGRVHRDRLMGDEGCPVCRGRKHRTTIPGKGCRRAPDLLDRDSPRQPNRSGSPTSPTRTWWGSSRGIVSTASPGPSWLAMPPPLGHRDGHHGAEDGAMAARSRRAPRLRLIHHSDAGSQYTPIAFAETLVLEGSRHLSAASATPMTMLWRRRRSGCSRPKPSAAAAHS
jgi:hypothetical protein